MVKPIVKDILFLGQKSVPATQLDMNVVNDLRDTLAANRERCVGMAANMIGYKKNMIIVSAGPGHIWLQSMPINQMASVLRPYFVSENNK